MNWGKYDKDSYYDLGLLFAKDISDTEINWNKNSWWQCFPFGNGEETGSKIVK